MTVGAIVLRRIVTFGSISNFVLAMTGFAIGPILLRKVVQAVVNLIFQHFAEFVVTGLAIDEIRYYFFLLMAFVNYVFMAFFTIIVDVRLGQDDIVMALHAIVLIPSGILKNKSPRDDQ